MQNNKLLEIKQIINLKSLDKPRLELSRKPNPNIGVIECETFTDVDDRQKVYCLGLKTNSSEDNIVFYINQYFNSKQLVLRLIDEMLRPKYNKTTFYCHNLGG